MKVLELAFFKTLLPHVHARRGKVIILVCLLSSSILSTLAFAFSISGIITLENIVQSECNAKSVSKSVCKQVKTRLSNGLSTVHQDLEPLSPKLIMELIGSISRDGPDMHIDNLLKIMTVEVINLKSLSVSSFLQINF